MAANGEQTATPAPAGFWKTRHVVIGVAVLGLFVMLLVKSCGGDAEDDSTQGSAENAGPRQGIAVQRPAPGWEEGQYPPVQQPYAPSPGYSQQQPGYGAVQQQPAYGGGQQPAYGGYQQQQQPAYGNTPQPTYGYTPQPAAGGGQQQGYTYSQQQQYQPVYGTVQQPAYATSDPENPWAAQQQRSYGYGAQPAPQVRQPGWGEPQPQQPVYTQIPGSAQYRPLDEQQRTAEPSRAPAPATVPVWPSAPYDRRGGSSFGGAGSSSGYPYAGGYPGYYAGAPYGAPGVWPGGFGSGWPGGMGFPGVGWPMGW